jgi:hypothetical protein
MGKKKKKRREGKMLIMNDFQEKIEKVKKN